MEISFLFRITASGGGVVGNVYGWGCGNNQVQTGCVQGKTESKMLQKWNKLNSLKVAKWMKDEWRMNEGWMKDEWRMNDEGWWFQAVEGFWLWTDRQTY